MMPQTLFCWRCQIDIPMLDEHEWREMKALLSATGAADANQRALDFYYERTGLRETNINALRHHRADQFGQACHHCSKPLRTKTAKLCAACGTLAHGGAARPNVDPSLSSRQQQRGEQPPRHMSD